MTGLVQPFISTVAGSLDSKGRVCIPAPWRQILAAQSLVHQAPQPMPGATGVYLCPSFIDPAIEAFGQALMDSVAARLATQDPFFSASFDDEATALIARTHNLTSDINGRVVLPEALIEHAGLKDKVIFVGKAQKFQIWDAARYAPVEAEALARLKDKMTRARTKEASGEAS